MRRLRIEPYDPDAVDGDGDGVVQEGTAWERPVGTRLIDTSGREIRRGAILTQRPSLGVVDGTGQRISYVPSYERISAGRQLSTLGQLGYPSLAERGYRPVRPMGIPTLADRGYRPLKDRYQPLIIPDIDPLQSLILLRLESRDSLDLNGLIENDNVDELLAQILGRSGLRDENDKSLLWSLLAGGSHWATQMYGGQDLRNLIGSLRSGAANDNDRLTAIILSDVYRAGGEAGLRATLRMALSRWGIDKDLDSYTNELVDYFNSIGVSAGDVSQDAQNALERFSREIADFITPNERTEIAQSQLTPDFDVPENESVSDEVERLGVKGIEVSNVATGLPFFVGVADILLDAPNGRRTMQTVLDFFNRRYDQNLTIDDVMRILDQRNAGDDREFLDKQVNHFFALLLQNQSVKAYIKRNNAERLADRVGNGVGQIPISDEAFEQIIRSIFSRADRSLTEGKNLPRIDLPESFLNVLGSRGIEIYPGRTLDDEALQDILAWSVFGTRPEWLSRDDVNPLVSILFNDRPYILKTSDSWNAPLTVVPALLMPETNDDPRSAEKRTLSTLLEQLGDSDGVTNTRRVLRELEDAERLITNAAYQNLARTLNRTGKSTGGPDDIVFNSNRNAEPPSAQLLHLLRDEGLSDEQLDIVSEFLGFNPLDDDRYQLFFANDEAPTTLVPELPSPLRKDSASSRFVNDATIAEYLEDVGSSLDIPIARWNGDDDGADGSLDAQVSAIIKSLQDAYGDDIILTTSLFDFAERVSQSKRNPEALRLLGHREDQPGREAIVAAMEYFIKQWQVTSNDANPRSLAIQDIAEEEFDIIGAYSFTSFYENQGLSSSMQRDLINVVRDIEGEAIRLFVRAQYADTQELLESQGIERIGIVRGFTMPTSHPDYDGVRSASDALEGESLTDLGIDSVHTMRPLSSWSTDTSTAVRFAKNLDQLDEERKEVVVLAEVPRQQIFGTAINGNGCLDEYEVVVLGYPSETRLYASDVVRQLNTDETVPEDTEGGLDSEWINLEVPDPRFADTSIPASITSIEVDELDVPTPSPNLDDVRDSAARELRSTPGRASREFPQNPELARTLESLVAVDVFSETGELDEIFRWYDGLDINDPELDPDYITQEQFERAREIAQVFEDTLEIKDGQTVDIMPTEIAVTTGTVEVSGEFYIGDQYAGRFSRSFFKQEGEDSLWVLHEVLFLEKDVQQLGIGRAFTSRWEQIYKSHGVSKILTNGASHRDNRWRGASHWPKQGFDWLNADSREQFFEYLELIPGSEEMLGLSREELATRVPRGVFVEGLSEGEPPSGDFLFDTPYFESVDSWVEFWETFKRARDEDFDDPYRVIPAELLAWAGADAFLMKHHAEVMYQKAVK